ncbi:uncharacterized protein GIQ15_00326 [Arthroderma uncinatum]|uniref:uncharacterized protein n=1 Tax=Arthroderma uncinatum TaxID=74035 RepID=UPI00144AF096|nr:uncharacterized protein GIQ15_00326 [Arthroderma uncinatum]KAF3490809.1 hypothetical protein GIQ15_00326 [Arthroderma uncinatum]
MTDMEPRFPEVTWWERSSDTNPERNFIELNIWAPDLGEAPTKEDSGKKDSAEKDAGEKDLVKKGIVKLEVTPTRVFFQGYSTTKKVTYQVDLKLCKEVDPENFTYEIAGSMPRAVVKLIKKDLDADYWEKLVAPPKPHYLKPDFGMYIDPSEQEKEEEPEGMDQLDFSKLGGGMEGMGGMPGMEGLQGMMQGMGGMPGMQGMQGMGGMEGAAGEEGDMEEDEEEMPELEGEEEAAGSTSKPKIEEIA